MALLALPPEVLTIIVRKLDTPSVCHLYETCKYLRDLLRMPGVVQSCQFTKNTLATARSFYLTMFRDISSHLKALNLSGVSDLHQAYIPLFKNLKNLIDLDVSFTKITFPDYLSIIQVVPTLKSLAINFGCVANHRIDNISLSTYQQAFKGLKNVHFITNSTYIIDSRILACILLKADLSNLKITLCTHHSIENGVIELDCLDTTAVLKLPQLQIYFIGDYFYYRIGQSRLYSMVDTNKYEIIVFKSSYDYNIMATPLLKEFICINFKEKAVQWTDTEEIYGQAAVMFWEKDRTQFDDKFYSKLMHVLKKYFIYSVPSDKPTAVPENYDFIRVYHSVVWEDYDLFDEDAFQEQKRARLAASSLAKSYNTVFENKTDNFKLRMSFLGKTQVSLWNCNFLHKLSHLILYEIRYTPSFFKILFECCDSLVTLEIERRRGIVSKPLTHLSKSKSLKNVLFYIVGTHLDEIFEFLSECRILENIHLVNTSNSRYGDLPDPTDLFTKCDKLYNFCYQASMYDSDLSGELAYYKDIRSEIGKHALNIDMFRYIDDGRRNFPYSPYITVFHAFRPSPI